MQTKECRSCKTCTFCMIKTAQHVAWGITMLQRGTYFNVPTYTWSTYHWSTLDWHYMSRNPRLFWLCLQHVKVPRSEIEVLPQQWPEPQKRQCYIFNCYATRELHRSSTLKWLVIFSPKYDHVLYLTSTTFIYLKYNPSLMQYFLMFSSLSISSLLPLNLVFSSQSPHSHHLSFRFLFLYLNPYCHQNDNLRYKSRIFISLGRRKYDL